MTAHKEHHRVHFNEGNDSFGKDNEILIQASNEANTFIIHLGFLQINHRYAISFSCLKTTMGVTGNSTPKPVVPIVPNFNCRFISLEVDENRILFSVELFAFKEKLLKEKLSFTVDDGKVTIYLQLIARVLGKGKGTPLLKDNIRCIEVEKDEDESEASDWQGFTET